MIMLLAMCGSAGAIPTPPRGQHPSQPFQIKLQAIPTQPAAAVVDAHPFVTEFYGRAAAPDALRPQKSLLKRTWNRVVSAISFR